MSGTDLTALLDAIDVARNPVYQLSAIKRELGVLADQLNGSAHRLNHEEIFEAICNTDAGVSLCGLVGEGAVHIAISSAWANHAEPECLKIIDAGTDDWNVKPREWLLGNVFCAEFISSILADGGVGKTSLRYAQYLSLAVGRPLTGEHVFRRCRVLVISLEDSINELRRRMKAACIHHSISQEELTGWMFYITLNASDGKIIVTDAWGLPAAGPLSTMIGNTIVKNSVDLVALDPFVKTHSVEENSNSAIDDVVQVLSDLTTEHNIAVDVPHHTSKGSSEPGNANAGRGASAMKDAARLVYTLNPMTKDEANALGVTEELRRSLIRMDSGKVNTAPPTYEAKWFRLVSVPLGNATEMYPNGDSVQTVETWSPPDIWREMSSKSINLILDDIDAGLPENKRYSDRAAAKHRAAWKIVVKHCPAQSEGPARQIISSWVKSGLLVGKEYHNDQTRKDEYGLWVDNAKRPTL